MVRTYGLKQIKWHFVKKLLNLKLFFSSFILQKNLWSYEKCWVLVNFVTIFENCHYVMNFLLYLNLKNIFYNVKYTKISTFSRTQPWKHLAGTYNFIQWKIYIVISFFLKVPFDCFIRLSNSTVTLKLILNQRACVCCCKKC